MDFVVSVVGKITECAMQTLPRQFGYLYDYKRNIQNLRDEVQRLDDQISGVQLLVDDAERNSRDPLPSVTTWQEQAQSTKDEMGHFLVSEPARVDNGCCLNGWCQNPLLRYTVSRKAKKNTSDVFQLVENGKFPADQIARPAQPLILVSTLTETTQLFQDFESRVIIMDKVMEALKKDDGYNLIRICGPGGVGKTTMVNTIVNKVREEKVFDEIAMAVVSQSPDSKKIQDAIAGQLGLKFQQPNEDLRAAELHERIVRTKKKFLLVLDDVWEELQFVKIGLPFEKLTSGGNKILFSSRFDNACLRSSEINISSTNFKVPTLSEEEAWSLFKERAGNCCETPDILPIAEQVVKECGGLPIAIVTVGSALRAVGSDKREWSFVLRNLESGRHGDEAHKCIRLSYDYLKPVELQRFFLLCCLFPEDANIPIETLLRYGMGIGLIGRFNNSVQDARDEVHSFVRNLRSLFLLLESEKPEHVRMHDVVRDVGISSIRSEDEEFGIMKYYEKSEQVTDCTELKLLWLSQPEIALDFFEGMEKLKVLTLSEKIDYYRELPELPPFQFQGLENIQTLCLEGYDLSNIDLSSIGALRSLEILSFYGSWGVWLPSKLRLLTRLRLLDCTNTSPYSSLNISYGVLSGLKQLENLYLGGNEVEWAMEEEGKEAVGASIAEFRCLLKLTTLAISLPNPHLIGPNDLHFEKLIKFQIGIGCNIIGENWEEKNYEFPNRLDMRLKVEERIDQHMVSLIDTLLKKTEILNVEEEEGCLNSDSEAEDNLFDLLQLSGGSPSLGHIQSLHVHGCHSLKYVFPFNIATDLLLLKSLKVSGCSMIEEVFHQESMGRREVERARAGTFTIKLPQLTNLELLDLPKLTAMSKSGVALELPQLKTLEISDLKNLKTVFTSTAQSSNVEPSLFTLLPSDDWTKQFQNLQLLRIESCPEVEVLFEFEKLENATNSVQPQLQELHLSRLAKLKHVWKNGAQASQGFQNLKILLVSCCENIEHTIGAEEDEDEEGAGTVLFPRLAKIELKGLNNLICFFSGNKYTLQWMSMKDLKFVDCPKMKTFISSGITTSHDHYLFNENVKLRKLEIENIGCEMIWHCKTQVSVEEMTVSHCHKLKNVLASSRDGIKKVDSLDVSECDSVGVVFEFEYCEVGTDLIICNGLRVLTLHGLPKLNCIWNISSCGDPHLTIEAVFTGELQMLHLDRCPSLHRVARSVVFPKLYHLDIRNCSSMEEIFGNDDEATSTSINITTFSPNLGSLVLEDNANLECIMKGVDAEKAAQFSLQDITIRGCPKLGLSSYSSLLSNSELRIARIEFDDQEISVEINECSNSMLIDGVENLIDMLTLDGKSTPPKYLSDIRSVALQNLLTFPAAVWWHYLQSLPNLVQLGISSCGLVEVIFGVDEGLNPKKLPQLTKLTMTCLEKLRCVWMKGIPRALSQRFHNLRELLVGECHSLRNILTLSMVKHLPRLTTLTVENCRLVEEICVEDEGEEINYETIEFPQVKNLTFKNLPNLNSFCTAAQVSAFKWLSLREFVVYGCPRLETFTLAASNTPKLKNVTIQSKTCHLMEDLNATIQHQRKGKSLSD